MTQGTPVHVSVGVCCNKHSCISLLLFDQIVTLRAVETSGFITTRCTEGSTNKKYMCSCCVLEATRALSTCVAANHGCCGEWADAQIKAINMGTLP